MDSISQEVYEKLENMGAVAAGCDLDALIEDWEKGSDIWMLDTGDWCDFVAACTREEALEAVIDSAREALEPMLSEEVELDGYTDEQVLLGLSWELNVVMPGAIQPE